MIFITGETAKITGVKEIAGFITEMNIGYASDMSKFVEFKITGTPIVGTPTESTMQFEVSLERKPPLPTFSKNKVIKTVGDCLEVAHEILDREEEQT
jgi:hypothetical protein